MMFHLAADILRKWMVLLLVLQSGILQAQPKQVAFRVIDCSTGNAVPGLHCYDAQGRNLGSSDTSGTCSGIYSFPLMLQKQGYEPVYLYSLPASQSVCLFPLHYTLGEVTVASQKLDPATYLQQLYNANKKYFTHPDTTFYYRFSYRLFFPASGWTEEIKGYVAWHQEARASPLPLPRKEENIYLVQYTHTRTDSAFVLDKSYKKIKPITAAGILMYDMMAPGLGAFAWQLFGQPHIRRILLRKENSDKKFFTYRPSDKEYVMEKITFDSTSRLTTIEMLSPDLFASEATLFNPYNFSQKNSEHSYCYTRYTYTPGSPAVTSIDHESSFSNKKTAYQTNISFELSGRIPEATCRIPLRQLVKGDDLK